MSGPWGERKSPDAFLQELSSFSQKQFIRLSADLNRVGVKNEPMKQEAIKRAYKIELANEIAATMSEIRSFYGDGNWLLKCKGSVPSTLSFAFLGR